jgi:regulator of sigma E protease
MLLLSNAVSILLLVIGFGFVIFWHELGHFLAAKWVGIKVEQFAVGMGHALVSFRKGIGVKFGNTRAEYERRVIAQLDARHASEVQLHEKIEYTDAQKSRAAEELGLGETEYRLSWIPVGGYVKMLGQDDLRPGADAEDPRAFNKKTIPQRMLVVSAGVVMNIILAAILFMVLFLYGFRAPSPVVGQVMAGSPAQQAGIRPGDTILAFNGQPQQDFTKVTLNTALASADEPMQVTLHRFDTGKEETVEVQPVKPEGAAKAFLALGIYGATSLQGVKERDWPDEATNPDLELRGIRSVRPGDVITKVNGRDVRPSDIYRPGDPGDQHLMIEAAQGSHGRPVELTIRRKDGRVETVSLPIHFQTSFMDTRPFNIAGMQPRARVEYLSSKDSPVFGKIHPGDVMESVEVVNATAPASQPGDRAPDLSVQGFIKTIGEAGAKDQSLNFVVLHDGKREPVPGIKPQPKLAKDANNNDRKGVGLALDSDTQTPVIAAVIKDSPAGSVKDGLTPGSLITAVDDKPVKTWFDVRDALMAKAGAHKLTLLPPGGDRPVERTLNLDDGDVRAVADIRLGLTPLLLGEQIVVRQTRSPIQAMGWGVLETRDLILQFYVTLQRMFGGTVSASNLMGPLGIVTAGSRFAFKGNDWLIWFLAMISANLAVVNFLPIPIVDGGLFLFLIIEKIQGRPLSRRAQEYAQLAGLFLILGVFAMVTFNDITRMFGH